MVILSADEAIGMCSREGWPSLQKEVESPTTKFHQLKQENINIAEDRTKTGVTL